MSKVCDLHTHSLFSDGTWTPEEIVEEGERIGLSAVALCDHNTVSGLERFMAAAEGKKIMPVPGIELSTEYKGRELHILALMLEPEYYGSVEERLRDFLRRKEESNRSLIRALNKAGFKLDYDSIKARTAGGYVNRAHIALELKRQGAVSDIQQAFSRFLNPECGFYKPAEMPGALDTVSFIKSINAVSVLAHPFRSMDEALMRDFLKAAKPLGLRAMETMCSSYSDETVITSEKIAEEFSLLPSGGTDFHGDKKPDISLGVGRGSMAVPYEYLLNMLS